MPIINGKDSVHTDFHASLEFYMTLSYLLVMLLENPDKWGHFFTIFSTSAFMLTQYMD